MSNIHRGKAAFYLFEVDSLAPKVVSDLTRQAVALREQAVKAKTEAERNALRYEAEGHYLEAAKVIRATYGDSPLGDDIDRAVNAAISAIRMPGNEIDDLVDADL